VIGVTGGLVDLDGEGPYELKGCSPADRGQATCTPGERRGPPRTRARS